MLELIKIRNRIVHLMQNHLNELAEDSERVKVTTNPLKCEGMYINGVRRPLTYPDLQLNGTSLPLVHEVKLLGVFINDQLSWKTHVEHLVSKANKCIFILLRGKQFGFTIKTLQVLYQWYIRTGLEYAAPVWHSSLTKRETLRLERIQKRCFRIILGHAYESYENALVRLNAVTLEERRKQLTIRFGKALLRSPAHRHLLPPTMGQIHGRATRGHRRLQTIHCRKERYRKSTIPFIVRELNKL